MNRWIKSGWFWGGLLLIVLLLVVVGNGLVFAPALPAGPATSPARAVSPVVGLGVGSNAASCGVLPVEGVAERVVPAEQGSGAVAAPSAPEGKEAGSVPAPRRDAVAAPARVRAPRAQGQASGRTERPSDADRQRIADFHARIAGDPQSVLAACQALPPDKQISAYHKLFGEWALRDPEAALKAAGGLADGLREVMVAYTMSRWALINPEAALGALASVDELDENVRDNLTTQALSSMGRRDPMAAMDALAAAELADPLARSKMTGELLGRWVAIYGNAALLWLRDSKLDDAIYDRAIVTAVSDLSRIKRQDAVSLFTEFVAAGRMDHIADPSLYPQVVLAAKVLGVTYGATDYPAALEWGFTLPADSAAQAYVLSNVAFSQSQGAALPDMPWVAEMSQGFARTRVIAAMAYGRLLATRNTTLSSEVKRQLDADQYDVGRLKLIVQTSQIPANEKNALLSLL